LYRFINTPRFARWPNRQINDILRAVRVILKILNLEIIKNYKNLRNLEIIKNYKNLRNIKNLEIIKI
jgi:hypothetical protein